MVASSLTASNGIIVANNTAPLGNGGGLGARDSSTIEMHGDISFYNNHLTSSAASWPSGGGGGTWLYSSSFTGSGIKFADNTAIYGGGSISAWANSIVTLTDGVVIERSEADWGGGAFLEDSTLNLHRNILIKDNHGRRGGGGLEADSDKASIEVSDSVAFEGNTAMTTAGYGGGGVMLWAGASFVASKNVTFTRNRITCSGCFSLWGAGLLIWSSSDYDRSSAVIRDVMFEDNDSVWGNGGGIGLTSSFLDAENCTFKRNKAWGGGAIAIDGVLTAPWVTLKNLDIEDNLIWGQGFGGGIATWYAGVNGSQLRLKRNEAGTGGGICLTMGSLLWLQDSEFLDNDAFLNGGGMGLKDNSRLIGNDLSFVGGSAPSAGAIYAELGNTVTLERFRCQDNSATEDHGGCIYMRGAGTLSLKDGHVSGNHAEIQGGSMFLREKTTAHIRDAVFTENRGFNGAAIQCFEQTSLSLENVQMTNNWASTNGGAVMLAHESSLVAKFHVTFVSNYADGSGGAMYGHNLTTITLSDGVLVQDNSCRYGGGGILGGIDAHVNLLGNVTVSGNRGPTGVGGVRVWARTTLTMVNDVHFSSNVGGLAGSIYVERNAALVTSRDSGMPQGVVIEGSISDSDGGGIALQDSHAILQDTVIIGNTANENLAVGGGGGVAVKGNSFLSLTRCSLVGNTALASSGGACFVDPLSTLAAMSSNFTEGMAASGGGLFLRGSATIDRCGFWENTASMGGGCIGIASSASVQIAHSSFHKCSAGANGGGLQAVQWTALHMESSTVTECKSGGSGGAVSSEDRSTVNFAGDMQLSDNLAEVKGGAAYLAGAECLIDANTMVVDSNTAGHGGGMYYLVPMTLSTGRLLFSSNAANENGGGVFGLGGLADFMVMKGSALEFNSNSAKQNGGAIALFQAASVRLSQPECTAACLPEMRNNNMCDFSCMTPECNFDNGECNHRFVEGGAEATHECDRWMCTVSDELHLQTCSSDCMRTSCDFSGGNSVCQPWIDAIFECPRFDAVLLDSLSNQPDLIYLEGGSVNGFGRCNSGQCTHDEAAGKDWCTSLDDGGRVIDQACDDCEDWLLDVGPAWGWCSTQPRLAGAGFNYDKAVLESQSKAPIQDLLQQYPGCGETSIQLTNNSAGLYGGAWFKESCDARLDETGLCLVGHLHSVEQTARIISFEDNRAGAAGGAVFLNCPDFAVCIAVMNAELGIPSSQRNEDKRLLRLLPGNKAGGYGPQFAATPFELLITSFESNYTPGQTVLHFNFSLVDQLGQTVRGTPAAPNPYLVAVLICDVAQTPCTTVTSLQPPQFHPMRVNDAQSSTLDIPSRLMYCVQRSSEVVAQIYVTGDTHSGIVGLSKRVAIQCLPCNQGQALVEWTNAGGLQLWTCNSCDSETEYILDPLDTRLSCQPCPLGAICDGTAKVVSKLDGAVWEPDFGTGTVLLKSCPPGSQLINSQGGVFSQSIQQCLPCRTCTDPSQFCSQAEYIVDPNKHSCETCPSGAECDGSKLRTADGLDITGSTKWEVDTTTGKYVLKQCPTGYKLESSEGHDDQRCEACGPGQYILSSDDPHQICRPCPGDLVCPNSGPPIAKSQVVTAQISLGGLEMDLSGATGKQQLKDQILDVLGDGSNVEITSICTTSGECIDLTGRRQIYDEEVFTVTFQAFGDDPANILSAVNSPSFVEDLARAVSGSNQTVDVAVGASSVGSSTFAGQYVLSDNGIVLVSCPAGFLLVNATADSQYCYQCPPLEYSVDPLDGCDRSSNPTVCPVRDCTPCPVGAICRSRGMSTFESVVNGSKWELVETDDRKMFRLHGCPPGYVLVRNNIASFDQCVECPNGRYSFIEAAYESGAMTHSQAQSAGLLCSVCPGGARCDGGTQVWPLEGYWKPNRTVADLADAGIRNVTIYRCGVRSCKDGGECYPGRKGQICGICAEGYSKLGLECRSCNLMTPGGYRVLVVSIIVPLICLWCLLVVWRPMLPFEWFDKMEFIKPRFQIKGLAPSLLKVTTSVWIGGYVTDYSKIFVSFWQVVSSFGDVFDVDWPSEWQDLWTVGKLFRLDFLNLPGAHCAVQELSFFHLLLLNTVSPLVVAIFVGLPLATMKLLQLQAQSNYREVYTRFWYYMMLWLYVCYPLVSVSSLAGFNCREIEGVSLLTADLSPCPIGDPSNPIFIWSVICCAIYPVGIPVSIWYALCKFKVPEMVATKRSNAVLREIIKKYRRLSENRIVTRLWDHLSGVHSNDGSVDFVVQRSRTIYEGVTNLMTRTFTLPGFISYLRAQGLSGDHESELESIFLPVFEAETGRTGLEKFTVIMAELAACRPEFEEELTSESISDVQLMVLCSFQWKNQVLDADVPTFVTKDSHGEVQTSYSMRREDEAEFPEGNEDIPICSLDVDASRSDRIRWLEMLGRAMVKTGFMSVPPVRWTGATDEEQLAIDCIGFLFQSYDINHYYFEFTEMLRKLTMTSILVFVFPGTAAQMASGFVATCIAIYWALSARPFTSAVIDNIHMVCLITQSLALFWGILNINHDNRDVGDEADLAMRAIVTCLHGAIIGFPLLVVLYLGRGRLWRLFCCHRITKALRGSEEDRSRRANIRQNVVPRWSQGTFNMGLRRRSSVVLAAMEDIPEIIHDRTAGLELDHGNTSKGA